MQDLLDIDGSQGEGGGQVLRTSLALSVATGTPVRVRKVRAGRERPGLLRQHLTAVRAAAEISGARVAGDELGSDEVELRPGAVRAGDYRFRVGTAGSTTLVLQTVLLPLALACAGEGPSRVRIEGGTHNPSAPPFEFLAESYLPLLSRMGVRAEARLVRHGFHPAGGGAIEVEIERTAGPFAPLELTERGALVARRGRVLLARLPERIGEEERRELVRVLRWSEAEVRVARADDSLGPGNAVTVTLEHEHATNVFTAFGRKGLPARRVAQAAAAEARRFLGAGVPVDRHLADQLVLPLALLAGGRARTSRPTRHTETNVAVVRSFGLEVACAEVEEGRWELAREAASSE